MAEAAQRSSSDRPISVLVVDDEPRIAELAATMLERERESIEVEAVTAVSEALDRFRAGAIDCIVSDYEMPSMTGLELLETIREEDSDLPFILYTGRGSEDIATDAIAAGATQYLQKKSGREQYALLANQISNAVSQYRAEEALRSQEQRYQRTLTRLHETTRNLMRAGTKTEIHEAAVETAADILGVPYVASYGFDPAEGMLKEVAVSAQGGRYRNRPTTVEQSESPIWEAFSSSETVPVTGGPEQADRWPAELITPLGNHGVLVAGTESAFDDPMREVLHILAANTEAALDRAEREQLLREHDRKLTQQNEELTRLNHANEIVRDINHGITRADTRAEIEETVCDRLADADRYLFAWIATNDTDPPTPSSWAGIDVTYIDTIEEDGPEIDLLTNALATGELTVASNVLDNDGWESRRREALTYGFQTVIAIPIRGGNDGHYGALLIYLTGADAIDEPEREILGELGETVGTAIRSAEQTRSMVTDNRVELELTCSDTRLLLNRLSTAVEGELTLQGMLRRSGSRMQLFLTVPTASVEQVIALPTDWEALEDASVVSEGEDVSLVELEVVDSRLLARIAEYDAALRSATTEDGNTALIITVPASLDTRTVVEGIQEDFPDTELAARRESTTVQPVRGLEAALQDRLTDRQLEALQAAHYGGFFQWPREATGEDLATTLDVSPPTYHYHLRAAQRKLVGLALERGFN